MFRKEYAEVFEGTAEWKAIDVVGSDTYDWQDDSNYIRLSPFGKVWQEHHYLCDTHTAVAWNVAISTPTVRAVVTTK